MGDLKKGDMDIFKFEQQCTCVHGRGVSSKTIEEAGARCTTLDGGMKKRRKIDRPEVALEA